MEIAAVPQRPASVDRRRLLLGLLVLLPVMLFVLLPAVLGVERYVITDDSMSGAMGRGSVALAQPVPAAELRKGDVITFHAPAAGEGDLVTRRIVALHGLNAKTQGDANAKRDPWTLELSDATYPRVVADVPWVGYPFISGGWVLLALIASLALLGAAWAGWAGPKRQAAAAAEPLPTPDSPPPPPTGHRPAQESAAMP